MLLLLFIAGCCYFCYPGVVTLSFLSCYIMKMRVNTKLMRDSPRKSHPLLVSQTRRPNLEIQCNIIKYNTIKYKSVQYSLIQCYITKCKAI